MVLLVEEAEMTYRDIPNMSLINGYSRDQSLSTIVASEYSFSANVSERTITQGWSSVKTLDDSKHKPHVPMGKSRYMTIQEEEYSRMKNTLEKVMNKNFLLQEKVEALNTSFQAKYESSAKIQPCTSSFSQKQHQCDDDENEHIQHLKSLALDIAECKAENDLKEFELNRLRSQLNICCPKTYKDNFSRRVITLLENRLQYCRRKTYEDQNQFFIEYIVSLSVLYAECKAEKDSTEFELMKLKNIANVQDNQKNSEIRSCRTKPMRRWLKNRLSRSRSYN